jgi:hypothetical protein
MSDAKKMTRRSFLRGADGRIRRARHASEPESSREFCDVPVQVGSQILQEREDYMLRERSNRHGNSVDAYSGDDVDSVHSNSASIPHDELGGLPAGLSGAMEEGRDDFDTDDDASDEDADAALDAILPLNAVCVEEDDDGSETYKDVDDGDSEAHHAGTAARASVGVVEDVDSSHSVAGHPTDREGYDEDADGDGDDWQPMHGGHVRGGGQPAAAAECCVLSSASESSEWRKLLQGTSGQGPKVFERAHALAKRASARIKAGHSVPPTYWKTRCRTLPPLERFVRAMLDAAWSDEAKPGNHIQRHFALHGMPTVPVRKNHELFRQDMATVLYLCGLGAQKPLIYEKLPLLGGTRMRGQNYLEYAVADPVPAVCSALLAFESTESLQDMADAPFFALATDRSLVCHVSGDVVEELYSKQDQLSAPKLAHELHGYLHAVDAHSSVRLAADHARRRRVLRPQTKPFVRVPLRKLLDDSEVRFPDHFARMIVRCDDGDDLWRRLQRYFNASERGREQLCAVKRASVQVGEATFVFRVSHAYEDGWEAMVASGNIASVRVDLERDGSKTFMLPIALSRDGVSVSFADGRSVVPVMAAAQCGSIGKWWSPRHMVALSVGAKVSPQAKESDKVLDYNARRLAHAELRTILVRIAHALQGAIEGKPTVKVVDDVTGDTFIPIPYFASLIVDQPEESTLSCKKKHWCVSCNDHSPLESLLSLMTSPMPRWHDPAPQKPGSVMRYVNDLEAGLVEVVPRLDRLVRRSDGGHYVHFMHPIVPIEAFGEIMTVFPDEDVRSGVFRDTNVMLRRPGNPLDGRRPFSGDPMHLFSLAIQHTMEELREIFSSRRDALRQYKQVWVASSSKDEGTVGVGGRHKVAPWLSLPAHHNERERYAFLLRATLVASRLSDPCVVRFVDRVMLPLAEAIMAFYSAHDRELGQSTTLHSWVRVSDCILLFCEGYNCFFEERLRNRGVVIHDARFMSHHNLIHCVDAWRRFGTPVVTHMSPFEKGHHDARVASRATTRQYCNVNPTAQVTQTRALWRTQMTKSLWPKGPSAGSRRERFHGEGWIARRSFTSDMPPNLLRTVNRAAQELRRAHGRFVADNGNEVEGPLHVFGTSTECWIAINGYALEVKGYTPGGNSSAIPFLLAVHSVRIPAVRGGFTRGRPRFRRERLAKRRRHDAEYEDDERGGLLEADEASDEEKDEKEEEEDEEEDKEEGGEEGEDEDVDTGSCAIFVFGAAVQHRVGDEEDSATVTILLGHAPSITSREVMRESPIANVLVPKCAFDRYDHACFLADVGGVLGGLWTPTSAGGRMVSTFGPVHAALVAPRPSWLK